MAKATKPAKSTKSSKAVEASKKSREAAKKIVWSKIALARNCLLNAVGELAVAECPSLLARVDKLANFVSARLNKHETMSKARAEKLKASAEKKLATMKEQLEALKAAGVDISSLLK